ncbi:MAG: FliM/FliN family flagellar motor switch protein [Pseudomonadota bacterium]
MKKSNEKTSETLESQDFEAFEEMEEDASLPAPAHEEEGLLPGNTIVGENEEMTGMDEPISGLSPEVRAQPPVSDGTTAARTLADELAELAPDVPVNLVAVIGKMTTDVGALIKYRVGQVVDLGRAPGETVDLVANGRLIARGELVEMEGKMGVRILKMVR